MRTTKHCNVWPSIPPTETPTYITLVNSEGVKLWNTLSPSSLEDADWRTRDPLRRGIGGTSSVLPSGSKGAWLPSDWCPQATHVHFHTCSFGWRPHSKLQTNNIRRISMWREMCSRLLHFYRTSVFGNLQILKTSSFTNHFGNLWSDLLSSKRV